MDQILKQLGITIDFEFVLIFASLLWIRILAVTSVVPFLFGRPVPRKIVVGTALVITFFMYPLLKPASPPPIMGDFPLVFTLYLKEVFIGLAIGFAASMVFYGFEAAGRMIDDQRGASLARVLIPQLGEQGSVSGQLIFQLAVVLYLVFGGHLIFFKALFESYQLVPVLEFPNVAPGLFPLMDFFMVLAGRVLLLAVQIAAPVIIAMLLADLILGITNRFAPQINVWELGFNIRGTIGILALFLALMVISREIKIQTGTTSKDVKTVVDVFSGVMPEDLKDVETPPELKDYIFRPTGELIKPPSAWDRTIRLLKQE